jgi:hypothetical protein
MFSWVRRNAKWAIPGGLVLAGVGLWLIFGYFGFQTLFFDDEVNEDVPVFASGAGASGLESDAATEAQASEVNEVMVEEGTPTEDPVDEDMPDMPEPEVVVQYQGSFIDRSHPTEGIAEVLSDGSAQRFLRFEDFATDNGPDLNVYLSTAAPDAPAGEFDVEFIDLGDLKGNIGPQNYEIPADVDLDRFSTVVIWCVRFRVAFGAAELA